MSIPAMGVRPGIRYARPGRGNDGCDSHGVTNQPPKYIYPFEFETETSRIIQLQHCSPIQVTSVLKYFTPKKPLSGPPGDLQNILAFKCDYASIIIRYNNRYI